MTDIKSLPKVLYIEDNDAARALVRRVLAGSYIVLEAHDPLDGIELAQDTQPNLVLCDINLPGMTGIEVAIRLRSLLRPGTPIVALTADTSPGARERALAAGFSGVLNKPIDVDTFEEQVQSFLSGQRETLDNPEEHLRAYQSELVERMEARVRELTTALNRNTYLTKQNQIVIEGLQRRQRLLEAGARVSHEITSILDLDTLLSKTVAIICTEFGFYYAGIFLVSDDGQHLSLHAAYGEPAQALLREGFTLTIDAHSMNGRAVLEKRAQMAPDVTLESERFRHPLLPDTGAEISLPLIFKERVLGSLNVQTTQAHAFAEEDVTALQSLADQIAVAIHNAQLLRQLEEANRELVRSKTFEAIATATGEAIHWVGNKAAPVPGSVRRLREDLLNLLAVFRTLITAHPAAQGPFAAVAESLFEEAELAEIDLKQIADELSNMPAKRLTARISLESMLEDLKIIENSATTILNIKEDLIGPARQRNPQPFDITAEITRIVAEMALPKGVVTTEFEAGLPLVMGDPRQIDQVYNNLIKNAWEAITEKETARIHISARRDSEPGFILTCVRDNGPGIPPDMQEKIWVSFFTTKAGKGGTGLGLSACMEIVRQNGGKIWVESQPGQGAAFFVRLPIAK